MRVLRGAEERSYLFGHVGNWADWRNGAAATEPGARRPALAERHSAGRQDRADRSRCPCRMPARWPRNPAARTQEACRKSPGWGWRSGARPPRPESRDRSDCLSRRARMSAPAGRWPALRSRTVRLLRCMHARLSRPILLLAGLSGGAPGAPLSTLPGPTSIQTGERGRIAASLSPVDTYLVPPGRRCLADLRGGLRQATIIDRLAEPNAPTLAGE